MTHTEHPLLSHVLGITRALDACWPDSVVRTNKSPQIPDSEDVARHFVLRDMHETATLLTIILEFTEAIRTIGGSLTKSWETEGPQTIDPGSEKAALLNLLRHRYSQLRVLTKTLYEWLYHLREDIKGHVTLNAAVPKHLWSQLDRYCTFRNKLIAHKKSLKTYGDSGIRFASKFSKMEILMVPVTGLPATAAKELNALFEKAMGHIEPHEANEQNIFERMSILYRRLDRFPGDLQKRVTNFVAQYGAVSDTPDDIAAFLEEFVIAISPQLRRKQPTNALQPTP